MRGNKKRVCTNESTKKFCLRFQRCQSSFDRYESAELQMLGAYATRRRSEVNSCRPYTAQRTARMEFAVCSRSAISCVRVPVPSSLGGGGERTACQVNEPFTPSNIVSRKLAETAKQKDHHSHNITVNRHRESRPLANTHLVQMASQHSLSKAQTTNLQTHTIGARFFQSPARQTTVVRPCWPSLLTFAFFALTACPQHIRACGCVQAYKGVNPIARDSSQRLSSKRNEDLKNRGVKSFRFGPRIPWSVDREGKGSISSGRNACQATIEYVKLQILSGRSQTAFRSFQVSIDKVAEKASPHDSIVPLKSLLETLITQSKVQYLLSPPTTHPPTLSASSPRQPRLQVRYEQPKDRAVIASFPAIIHTTSTRLKSLVFVFFFLGDQRS